MIREAIILAGGLGTRLREAVPDLPKCMAPVDGRPFLFYVINYLRLQGVEKFIFSLGYRQEQISTWLEEQFPFLSYQLVIEEEPLGTGGAIQKALRVASEKNLVVVNGDTLYKAELDTAAVFHTNHMAECTLLLKPMTDFDRYGVVELEETGLVKSFQEKRKFDTGTINGGIYLLNRDKFLDEEFPEKFSFEKEYLEKFYTQRRIYGYIQDAYFIDIGIPEDYQRACAELAARPPALNEADKSWTLFLDRDGVINVDKDGSYIFSPDEFQFTEGGPAHFRKLSEIFGRIVIVTNQRGVGRGLMTEEALHAIHDRMRLAIEAAGGRIDEIFYCTSVTNDHPDRKPNPGMAVIAKRHFPEIDFSRSMMVGNNLSDMLFGRNAGMYTVFIKSTRPNQPLPHPDIDLAFNSLDDFVKAL